MTSDRIRALDEMVADLLREGSPISTDAELALTTSVDETNGGDPPIQGDTVQAADGEVNTTTMAHQAGAGLDGLNLDIAIRLRWVLRDIKAKRTKLSPVSPDDLQTLIGMGLVEMRDEAPLVTNEGERALDWS
jgi:hypothetical protein